MIARRGRGKFHKGIELLAHIAFVFEAGCGSAVAEFCRKAGISEATLYNLRKKYAGSLPSEMKRVVSPVVV